MAIAFGGKYPLQAGLQAFHRHELGQVAGIDAPGVDNLLTMGIDDLARLNFVQTNCAAAPRREDLKFCNHIPIPPLQAYLAYEISVIGQGASRIEAIAWVRSFFGDHPRHFLSRPSPWGADDAYVAGSALQAVCAADVASQPTDQ
jgi:hypothetical protein